MIKALYLAHPRGITDRMIAEIHSIPGMDLEVEHQWDGMSSGDLADRIREFEILLLSRDPVVPQEIAGEPGNLKYICFLHGSVKRGIGLPMIQSGITVTNWGDCPARGLATGSMILLFACLKDLHKRIMAVRRGEGKNIDSIGGDIRGLRVGVYGYGFAGKAFVELVQPLGAQIFIYDPYVNNVPAGCKQVDSLDDLFGTAQAIVILAGMTDETAGSVTAERLAMLPDQGVIVNMARGAIIDQDALFAELKSGRLRAGLDVLAPPDILPEDHEARKWENLIWTCHHFASKNWPGENGLCRRDEVVLGNLRAYVQGDPLQYVINERIFHLMT